MQLEQPPANAISKADQLTQNLLIFLNANVSPNDPQNVRTTLGKANRGLISK